MRMKENELTVTNKIIEKKSTLCANFNFIISNYNNQ